MIIDQQHYQYSIVTPHDGYPPYWDPYPPYWDTHDYWRITSRPHLPLYGLSRLPRCGQIFVRLGLASHTPSNVSARL